MARRAIVGEMDGADRRQIVRAGDAHDGAGRLRGEAQAPIGAGDPVAQFRRAILGLMDAAAAHQTRRALGAGEGQQARHARILRQCQEGFGIGQAIGGGGAAQIAQDRVITDGLSQGGGIFHPAWPQQQAGGTGEHSRLSSSCAPIAANHDGLTTVFSG